MISLILTLVVVGVLLWLVETYIPMDPMIKKIIRIVAIVCIILFLLNAFGVLHYADVGVPQVR